MRGQGNKHVPSRDLHHIIARANLRGYVLSHHDELASKN